MNIKGLLKTVAALGGLDIKKLNAEARLALSQRRFHKQGYLPIDGYDVTRHFGDQEIDPSFRFVVEGFISARIQFVREILGDREIERSMFADVGDSNGIFLKALGKRGTSVNISQKVLDNIVGLDTVLGGLPIISLPDGSFDYVLCFETVEHLHDPIGGLKELARLASKGVVVSIPFVGRTNIHPYWPDKSRPPTEQHVVECSDEDFRKLLTYANLRVASMTTHRVFDWPKSVREGLVDLAWRAVDRDVLCGSFRRFSIYCLVHNTDSGETRCR